MTILTAEIYVPDGEPDPLRRRAHAILAQAMAHPTALDGWPSLAAAGTVDYMLGYVDLKLTPYEHQDFIDQSKVIIEQALVISSNLDRLRDSLQRWHTEENAKMFPMQPEPEIAPNITQSMMDAFLVQSEAQFEAETVRLEQEEEDKMPAESFYGFDSADIEVTDAE